MSHTITTVNPEAEACERLGDACRMLRTSALHVLDPSVTEAKRVAVLVAMAGLLDELALPHVATEVLAAREHFDPCLCVLDSLNSSCPLHGSHGHLPAVHRDAVAFVGGAL